MNIDKIYTVEEAEKIAPKECWASEYTEDERISAISTLLQESNEEAVRDFAHFSLGDATREQHKKADNNVDMWLDLRLNNLDGNSEEKSEQPERV